MKYATLLLPCLLIPALLYAAEKTKPYDGPVYVRPQGGYLPMKVDVYETKLDGLETNLCVLRSPAFNAMTFPPLNWSLVKDPQTSLAFFFDYMPEVYMTFTLWNKGFFPDLTPESMTGVAEGLAKRYAGAVKVLNYGSDYRPQGGIIAPLNQRVRMLAYDVTDPATQKVTRHYDYYLFYDDYLLEMSIKGPPDTAPKYRSKLGFLVNDLSILSSSQLQQIIRNQVPPPAARP